MQHYRSKTNEKVAEHFRREARMDEIKVVINELNQPPFNKNLNLIGYDNLRSEQRLDLLIEVLNVIDPKVGLFVNLMFVIVMSLFFRFLVLSLSSWALPRFGRATSTRSWPPYSTPCAYSSTIHHWSNSIRLFGLFWLKTFWLICAFP